MREAALAGAMESLSSLQLSNPALHDSRNRDVALVRRSSYNANSPKNLISDGGSGLTARLSQSNQSKQPNLKPKMEQENSSQPRTKLNKQSLSPSQHKQRVTKTNSRTLGSAAQPTGRGAGSKQQAEGPDEEDCLERIVSETTLAVSRPIFSQCPSLLLFQTG